MNYAVDSNMFNSARDTHPEVAGLESKLAGLDLNLLVALEALLLHRNVTLAARKIGQSQPAMSRALARLRDMLDDDLLVRGSNGLQLTARGQHLSRRLPRAMAQLREVCFLRQPQTQVSLTVDEHLSPLLMSALLRDRPHGNTPLRVGTHKTARVAVQQLDTRAADFVLGTEMIAEDRIKTCLVHAEDFVSLIAPHMLVPVGPEAFLRLTHARLMHEDDDLDAFPQVAAALHDRAPMFDIPDLTAAALVAARGELVLTVPRSVAMWLQRTVRLAAFAPPIAIAQYRLVIGWLKRDLHPVQQSLLDRLGAFAGAALKPADGGRTAAAGVRHA